MLDDSFTDYSWNDPLSGFIILNNMLWKIMLWVLSVRIGSVQWLTGLGGLRWLKNFTNKYNYKLIPFQHVITVMCLWSAELEAIEKNHSVNKLNKTSLLPCFPFTKLLITKILYRHFNSTCVKLILYPLSTYFSLFRGSLDHKKVAHTQT